MFCLILLLVSPRIHLSFVLICVLLLKMPRKKDTPLKRIEGSALAPKVALMEDQTYMVGGHNLRNIDACEDYFPDEPETGDARGIYPRPPKTKKGKKLDQKKCAVQRLKEIRLLQQFDGKLIPKAQFMGAVHGICNKMFDTLPRWQVATLSALHEAVEVYMCGVFEDANNVARHAKWVTVNEKDIALVRHLRFHLRKFENAITLSVFVFARFEQGNWKGAHVWPDVLVFACFERGNWKGAHVWPDVLIFAHFE